MQGGLRQMLLREAVGPIEDLKAGDPESCCVQGGLAQMLLLSNGRVESTHHHKWRNNVDYGGSILGQTTVNDIRSG